MLHVFSRLPPMLWLLTPILATGSASAQSAATDRVSISSLGDQANGVSQNPAISSDGRWIAFWSNADNLVPNDRNGVRDVFLHDRLNGDMALVSQSTLGAQANGPCQNPSVSADGRYVAFWGYASNLVPGDHNGERDVFVRDLLAGTTVRASVSTAGVEGNGESRYATISADGRFVAFESSSDNIVAGDTNGCRDVFVRDLLLGVTVRASVSSSGVEGNALSRDPHLSADGRYVVFASQASNLAAGDTNQDYDIYLRDFTLGSTERVSLSSFGAEAHGDSRYPTISADGNVISFTSIAADLVAGDNNGEADAFIRDRQRSTTRCVSARSNGIPGNDSSLYVKVSSGGQYAAFYSDASDLVPSDHNGVRDVFLCELASGSLELVSMSAAGIAGDDGSFLPVLSSDGSVLAYDSAASNLVPGDTNAVGDVFVRDRTSTGPALWVIGDCPGNLDFYIAQGEPGGAVAILFGAAGSHTRTQPPCAGLVLSIAQPSLGARLGLDARGTVHAQVQAPVSACGLTVQVVDLVGCRVSQPHQI